MAGKPRILKGGSRRTPSRGAARPTPGLTALDEQREASMADEGGASGMVMEAEEEQETVVPFTVDESDRRGARRLGRVLLMGAAAGLAFAAWSRRARPLQ